MSRWERVAASAAMALGESSEPSFPPDQPRIDCASMAGSSGERRPRVLAIDAGGTMTDTFIVDDAGAFVVGKAQTTPEDESAGFMDSARDALGQWGSSPEEAFGEIASGIYSGTAMLNRVLSRQGRRVGVIVTAGQA